MTLIHGNCIDIVETLPAQSVDAIITDLPYGTTACKWDTIIPFNYLWDMVRHVLKPRGAFVTTASQPFTSALVMSNLDYFKYELIWDKNYSGAPGLAKYRPMPTHENIEVFGSGRITYNPQMQKGKPYTDIRKNAGEKLKNNEHKLGYKIHQPVFNDGTRYPKSVIFEQKYNKKGQHPTQKPVSLYEYLIKTYTNEGDIVLDICMGSGTTGVACKNTGRNFIGIEKELQYFEIAKKRITNEGK
jgi:site-specific DNA-methyltransferase (adenine-specific)